LRAAALDEGLEGLHNAARLLLLFTGAFVAGPTPGATAVDGGVAAGATAPAAGAGVAAGAPAAAVAAGA